MASEPRSPYPPRLDEPVPVPPGWELAGDDLVTGRRLGASDLTGRELRLVDLEESVLDGTRLAGSRWYRGRWRDVEVARADLSNLVFTDSGWTRVQVVGSRLTGVGLTGAVLEDVEVSDSTLGFANLRQARLRRVRLRNCSLVEADLGGARCEDVVLEGCDLTGAQLSQVRATRLTLSRCTLSGVRGLSGLRGAVLEPSDLGELALQLAAELGITIKL